MQLNTQFNPLPQMNAETSKRDKALDKIATAVELKLEDSSSRTISDMPNFYHVTGAYECQ